MYVAAWSAAIGPSMPTICSATAGIGEVRSGPCASGVPSAANRVARGGSDIRRPSRSWPVRPGKQQVAGEMHGRARAATGEGHLERLAKGSEQPGGDDHLHRDVFAPAAPDVLRHEPLERRDHGVVLVGGREPRFARVLFGDRIEERVHAGVVTGGPVVDVVRYQLALGPAWSRTDNEHDRDRGRRENRQRDEQPQASPPQPTPAPASGCPCPFRQNCMCHLTSNGTARP